ncbi:hypothetical protein CTAYLR_000735 [Chrysophaeum taylorii]|uniref:Enoyl-CoA hydratase n=1 Tax=Chrysophaeum taylorii TaxID=2483200 RepID=A0AAD7U9G4_9STRA|nr:hypothetical protein CTAYLR_000735 [Chrysophaeum taylorii]
MARVSTTVKNGICVVKLARPEKLNALDLAMFRGIRDAAKRAAENDVRCVVVHGEGRAFCSGLDVRSTVGSVEELMRKDGATNLVQDVSYLWRRVPAPVIASVHGVCFGGGFQIALGADMRFAHPKTKFSIMEAKWGLVPDMGFSVVLPHILPRDKTKELVMTARVFEAPEARDLGLVTRIEENPLEAALEVAADIAAKSPDASRAAKRLVDAVYDHHRPLWLETYVQRKLLWTWNQLAMTAKSLRLPLVPGFLAPQPAWAQEADDVAQSALEDLLSPTSSEEDIMGTKST